jgi:hypothetical protein
MRRGRVRCLLVIAAIVAAAALLVVKTTTAQAGLGSHAGRSLAAKMHAERTSPADLELTGDLAGVPRGESRFLTREDLLAISQPMTISPDDGNFKQATQVRGVPLEDLIHALLVPSNDMVLADCKDKYQAHYERRYLADYHPVLVTALNGAPLTESEDDDYGPYMIAHVNFKMATKDPELNDEPQIPWGVVRLQFRDEDTALSPIAPRIANRSKAIAYGIAEENCLRCHNVGDLGGLKSGVNWTVLGALAAKSPDFFAAYVRDPKSKNPHTRMAASPQYDDATMALLIDYFRKFAPANRKGTH